MSEEVREDRFRNVGAEVRPMRRSDAAGVEVEPSRPAPQQLEVRVRDSLESFTQRLTALGATLDEIDAVAGAWDTWDEDDPQYSRYDLVRLDDSTLVRMLVEIRQEHETHTFTEEEQADRDYREAVAGALNEAQLVVVNSTVDGVLEWVGDDRARGRAAFIAELTVPDHKARKGVVEWLRVRFGFEDGDVPDE